MLVSPAAFGKPLRHLGRRWKSSPGIQAEFVRAPQALPGKVLPELPGKVLPKCERSWQGFPGKTTEKKLFTLLDLCVSSLRRGHANLLCIVPILTDDPRRESDSHCAKKWIPAQNVVANKTLHFETPLRIDLKEGVTMVRSCTLARPRADCALLSSARTKISLTAIPCRIHRISFDLRS